MTTWRYGYNKMPSLRGLYAEHTAKFQGQMKYFSVNNGILIALASILCSKVIQTAKQLHEQRACARLYVCAFVAYVFATCRRLCMYEYDDIILNFIFYELQFLIYQLLIIIFVMIITLFLNNLRRRVDVFIDAMRSKILGRL